MASARGPPAGTVPNAGMESAGAATPGTASRGASKGVRRAEGPASSADPIAGNDNPANAACAPTRRGPASIASEVTAVAGLNRSNSVVSETAISMTSSLYSGLLGIS